MASKDFMAPKTAQPVPVSQSSTSCSVPAYGVSSRPASNQPTTYTNEQSNAETARLARNQPTAIDQTSAETARLSRTKPAIKNTTTASAGAGRGFVHPTFVKPDNAYSHETDNIVTSGDNFERINLNLQFLPNILDKFDVVTYHWKLFITDPDTASTGKVLDTTKQTIIAETGVSDLTIDNVEVHAVTTPMVESGTGTSTDVKFEIIEPTGAGLIDKLFYESVALGIGNWAVMPIYLQLQFRSRDAINSDAITDGELSEVKWLWSLKITNIKANVTHVGTRYEFDAIVYDDFAQSNAIFTLQHNAVLDNIETFSDAMEKLQEKLNGDQLLKLISNYSIPDSFRIIVDPKLANHKIVSSIRNTNSSRNNNYVTFDNKDATFSSGTSVDKIIDTLLAHTEEFQTGMIGAVTPGQQGVSINEEPSQMKKFWRIVTETRPLKFDPRRQNTANEFTIFVLEYDKGILDSNVFQTTAKSKTIAAERKRLLTYVQKSILKKKYNYIFTGVNDQIINFDLTINNAFGHAQSRFEGIYNNAAMVDKGVVTHQHAEDEAKVAEALVRAISLQNGAKPADVTSVKVADTNARAAIAAASMSDSEKTRYTRILDNAKSGSKLTAIKDIQSAGGIDEKFTASKNLATSLAVPITDNVSKQQLRFISDVDITSSAAKAAYTELMENSKGKLRPIARIESLQDRQIGIGVESSSNSGLQKLSSMFSVALHSGLDTSFQRIKLTIKGDPFWLSPAPYKNENDRIFKSLITPESAAIHAVKDTYKKIQDSANYNGTDNFILVRFRSPKIYSADEGRSYSDNNQDIETFSGVYQVARLVSRFAGGKFEQDLECILDPEISILNIADMIEEDAKKQDATVTANTLTDGKQVPPTAIKQQKLDNQTAAETARLLRSNPTVIDQTAAETARLLRR